MHAESDTSPVKRTDDLPLFQLLTEDVDRLGHSLRDILVPFEQLHFIEEIAQGICLLNMHRPGRQQPCIYTHTTLISIAIHAFNYTVTIYTATHITHAATQPHTLSHTATHTESHSHTHHIHQQPHITHSHTYMATQPHCLCIHACVQYRVQEPVILEGCTTAKLSAS